MKTPKKEIQELSIVLVGSFNPQIFLPLWFSNNNLIRREEAENAKIEIITNQASIFDTDWFRLVVLLDKYMLTTTKNSYFEEIKDLFKGTFQLLSHTPVKKMGINWKYHYRAHSKEEWNTFGDTLAPKDVWNKIFDKPGLRRIDIENTKNDNFPGIIRVQVEPSRKISGTGIYIYINDHYDIDEIEETENLSIIISEFESIWNASKAKAEDIVKKIWGQI
jgi:hypothetical protein